MGVPKAGLILSSGLTMLEHVYRALAQVCRQVIFVGHGEGIPDSLRDVPRIADNLPDLGPIGALEALLGCGLDDEYLISPCDLFCVTPEVYAFLIHADGSLPIVLKNKNHLEPLLGRYESAMLPLLRNQIALGRRAMHDLLSAGPSTLVPAPAHLVPALKNANSPEDLPED